MRHGPAAAIFAGVALILVGPVLSDAAHLAIGHPQNDVWNHVWGYWWVVDSLLRLEVPVHTDLLNWPAGGSLWFIDAFGAVVTAPIQVAFGPVAAYNAAYFFNFWLCGFGAYVLAWQVTRSWEGAILAGVAYMTSPHLLGQSYNGISETLAAGWFPLAVAAVRELLREPTPRSGALAGAVWAFCTIANWYYGLFVGIVALGLAAGGWRQWRKWGGAGLAGAASFGALAAVPFTLFVRSMGADDAVVTRDPAFVWITLILHNMTDLETMVHPGKFYSPDLKINFNEDLIVVVYVGWVLLLAAIPVFFTRTGRYAKPWLALALVFALFTLGPYLYVHGDYLQVAGGWVPLPFLLFFKFFPMFERIAHAYRFILGVYLGFSILAAWTVVALESRGFRALPLAAGLGFLRVVESFWFSSAHFPIPVTDVSVHPVYATLEEGALLDLPVGVPVLGRAEYSVAQIVHRLPSPYGLNDPTPPYLFYNRYGAYLLEMERTTVDFLPARLPTLDLVLGRADLVRLGLRWIVVHERTYPAPQLGKLERFLDMTATATFDDDELRVYRLDP